MFVSVCCMTVSQYMWSVYGFVSGYECVCVYLDLSLVIAFEQASGMKEGALVLVQI